MNDRILRAPKFAAKLGTGERQLHREVAKGNIPSAIPISERTRGWRESLADKIISDREAGKKVTAAE